MLFQWETTVFSCQCESGTYSMGGFEVILGRFDICYVITLSRGWIYLPDSYVSVFLYFGNEWNGISISVSLFRKYSMQSVLVRYIKLYKHGENRIYLQIWLLCYKVMSFMQLCYRIGCISSGGRLFVMEEIVYKFTSYNVIYGSIFKVILYSTLTKCAYYWRSCFKGLQCIFGVASSYLIILLFLLK